MITISQLPIENDNDMFQLVVVDIFGYKGGNFLRVILGEVYGSELRAFRGVDLAVSLTYGNQRVFARLIILTTYLSFFWLIGWNEFLGSEGINILFLGR